MGLQEWILLIGLIFLGFLIGYPFGHIFGSRDAESRIFRNSENDGYGILDAQILENKRK